MTATGKGPTLIAFAGLPGTGKTKLARLVSVRLAAVYLRIDSIESALAQSHLKVTAAADAGYWAVYLVAEDNLRLGRHVVTDCVNPIALTRDAFRAVADRAGVPIVEVEVICSDPAEHRRRVEARQADLPGKCAPDWAAVTSREYEAWPRDRVVIDTAGEGPEASAGRLLAILAERDVA